MLARGTYSPKVLALVCVRCCFYCRGRWTSLSLLGLTVWGMVWRPCYLETVGGRQAALFPEAEGALQLLGGAQGKCVGLAQAAQQGQAGREAGQVVAAWDTGRMEGGVG